MTGYSTLGRIMGSRADLAMYRKFASLGAQNLLCMQAELSDLEAELKVMLEARAMSEVNQSWSKYHLDYQDQNVQMWRLKFVELSEKLHLYYDALLRTERVNRLAAPRQYDYGFLHHWLNHPCGGDFFLRGKEAACYEEYNAADLAVLSQRSEPGDSLAEYICGKVIPLYHKWIGHKLHPPLQEEGLDDMWEYKAKRVKSVGTGICMLLSGFVPAVSIFTLYFLQSTVARLAAITVMSLMFSLLMTFVIRASRGETFAATTAFAAVQVVFLGGTDPVS